MFPVNENVRSYTNLKRIDDVDIRTIIFFGLLFQMSELSVYVATHFGQVRSVVLRRVQLPKC